MSQLRLNPLNGRGSRRGRPVRTTERLRAPDGQRLRSTLGSVLLFALAGSPSPRGPPRAARPRRRVERPVVPNHYPASRATSRWRSRTVARFYGSQRQRPPQVLVLTSRHEGRGPTSRPQAAQVMEALHDP